MPQQFVTDIVRISQASILLDTAQKRILRKHTAVPHPKTTLLKPLARRLKLSKKQLDRRFVLSVQRDLKFWEEKAPVFYLKGVRLEDLNGRPKNDPLDKAEAQGVMNTMKTWESDGASAVFEDEACNPLVAYFARRRETNPKRSDFPQLYVPGPNTPSAMGRSPSCLDEAAKRGEKIYFDGIGKKLLDKTLVATQLLVHHLGVEHAPRDGRHDKGDIFLKYARDGGPPGGVPILSDDKKSFTLNGIQYLYQDNTFTTEVTGVLHLVHAWPDQAHDAETHGLHPSKDMLSGPHGAPHVYAYFKNTNDLALYLNELFRRSFPDYYEKYKSAFQAGKWTVVDPGPFLGRAIVWKMTVRPHRDGLDEGPAVIFPMGDFTGGECYIPDLKLKLTYRPGEVIILMAGALYHAIGDWTHREGVTDQGITPGRVSNVWFFPHSSYEVLKDKPANWAINNAGGAM